MAGEALTADQIAEKAAAEVEAEAGGSGGEAKPDTTPKPEATDFSEDDLDPEKIEAGLTAKTLQLDNAGIMKRFKKVHGSLKEQRAWRAEREPKLSVYEKQAAAVDKMLLGLSKYRSKDSPDKQGFLEDLIENLMDEKGTPNWSAAKEAIEQIIASAGPAQGANGNGKAQESTEQRQLRERLEHLENERDSDKAERAQSELNSRVAKAFTEIPKELNKIEEFKGLPWKDAEWKKEFEDQVDDKVLAWSQRNEDKVKAGDLPPFTEIAKQVAKIYLRGGSDILKKQVEGGGKGAGLSRGNGPSGDQTRKLPEAGNRDSEDAYAEALAASIED
jgi:hypothetical protein